MQRTVIFEKAGKIRIEREYQSGTQWILSTRLCFKSLAEALLKCPMPWRGTGEFLSLNEWADLPEIVTFDGDKIERHYLSLMEQGPRQNEQ